MGSPAKCNARAQFWTLHGHGNGRTDYQPVSTMMVKLPLGLSMILGRKAMPLAHLLN